MKRRIAHLLASTCALAPILFGVSCMPPSAPAPADVNGAVDVGQCDAGCARVASLCARDAGWVTSCASGCTQVWAALQTDQHAERWQTKGDARDAGFACP